jgi:hypothetical protein
MVNKMNKGSSTLRAKPKIKPRENSKPKSPLNKGITALWQKNPEQFKDKHISQVIAFCGEGRLRDGSQASNEFRNFLSAIPSDDLIRYAEGCLTEKFDDNGLALQDVVNEVGRRLGFDVVNGLYRGKQNEIGNDGLWTSPDQDTLIIEVKVTDVYSIDLDKIAEYRNELIRRGEIPEKQFSILIVVGRQDTGGFEAQVRGSRFAWDARLISVDALLRLMRLREEIEDPIIMHKIASILIPHEYTKVDGIIDVVFSTAEDVRQESEGTDVAEAKGKRRISEEHAAPVSFNEACIRRIEKSLKTKLIRRSRATFSTVNGETTVVCAVSREHDPDGSPNYWFAFHPHQKVLLDKALTAYVAFGCGSEARTIMIPYAEFRGWLDGMHITRMRDRFYWHIEIYREKSGVLELRRKKTEKRITLDKYLV